MTDLASTPTDEDISVMVDVARSAGAMLSDDKKALLPGLVTTGLIEPADSKPGEGDRYKLTSLGQSVLDDRGVGANEA